MFFDEVRKYRITVWIEKPDKFVFSIPNGDASLVSEKLWKILSWLHDEFLFDCATETAKKNSFPDSNFGDHNISRTISYVIHACLLEGVLKKMYMNMIITLQKYVNKSIIADNIELSKRKNEMINVEEFRNIVAAHTAYADPHPKKDDFLSEINSLQSFLSTSYDGKDLSSFTMNAVTIISNGKTSKRPIPKIKLNNLHQEMYKHFMEWEKIFISKLKESVKFLPIKNGEYRIDKL